MTENQSTIDNMHKEMLGMNERAIKKCLQELSKALSAQHLAENEAMNSSLSDGFVSA